MAYKIMIYTESFKLSMFVVYKINSTKKVSQIFCSDIEIKFYLCNYIPDILLNTVLQDGWVYLSDLRRQETILYESTSI